MLGVGVSAELPASAIGGSAATVEAGVSGAGRHPADWRELNVTLDRLVSGAESNKGHIDAGKASVIGHSSSDIMIVTFAVKPDTI